MKFEARRPLRLAACVAALALAGTALAQDTSKRGDTPSSLSALAGRWQASGKATEVEYGPEMVRSNFGLPAGQQMGVIGNGGAGTYAWGMRNSYKTYDVERKGELAIAADGKFSWKGATESRRSADCIRVTEFEMRGAASMGRESLILDISDGQQKVSYRGCPGTQTPTKTEDLRGQRGYEVKLEGGALKIRQVKPVSSISSSAVYRRG